MHQIYLTKEGYQKFEQELNSLNKKLPGHIKEVQEMASMGDRSENAGYQNAKSVLRKTQGRIRYLERLLRTSKIIKKSNNNIVQMGSTVQITDVTSNEVFTYTIVDVREINLEKGFISYNSPIGKALFNKKVGDKAKIEVNTNKTTFLINKIF